MPDLASLPSGASVFVDTNIFDLHFRGKSLSCTNFITRIALGEVEAYVNIQVLTDLLHKLMLAEACTKSYISTRSATKLKKCFQDQLVLAANLVDYQNQLESTLAIGLRVLPITEKLLIATKSERKAYSLLVADSLHLGTMNRRTIRRRKVPLTHMVTYDRDFARITSVTVWEPTDVSP